MRGVGGRARAGIAGGTGRAACGDISRLTKPLRGVGGKDKTWLLLGSRAKIWVSGSPLTEGPCKDKQLKSVRLTPVELQIVQGGDSENFLKSKQRLRAGGPLI